MWILPAEAFTHIYNRKLHKSYDFKTQLKKFSTNQILHLDKIKRFGWIAYARIPITDTKFSPKAMKAVLVSFSSSGYILRHPPTRKFLIIVCTEKFCLKTLSCFIAIFYNRSLYEKQSLKNTLCHVKYPIEINIKIVTLAVRRKKVNEIKLKNLHLKLKIDEQDFLRKNC